MNSWIFFTKDLDCVVFKIIVCTTKIILKIYPVSQNHIKEKKKVIDNAKETKDTKVLEGGCQYSLKCA